jgi:hypothetical protein
MPSYTTTRKRALSDDSGVNESDRKKSKNAGVDDVGPLSMPAYISSAANDTVPTTLQSRQVS